MRKALILTVLALFGSEALAQKSFRHTPTVALDDLQDNEMASFGFFGGGTVLINRPQTKTNLMDDFEDDFLLDGPDDSEYDDPGSPFYGKRDLFRTDPVPSDTFARQNPGFLGSGNTGYSVEGGRAPQGGIQSSGSGQYVGNIGNTGAQYIVGGSISYSPGAPVSITPHVGIKVSF